MNRIDETADLRRNVIAEREAIGSAIASPEYAPQAMRVRADDFTVPEHQIVWRAIANLLDKNDPIHLASVLAVCGNGLDEEARRGVERMKQHASGTSGVLEEALDAVIDASRRRSASNVFQTAARRAITSEEPIDTIVAKASSEVDEAVAGRQTHFAGGREVGRRLGQRLRSPPPRIKTGITKLDHVLGGGMAPGRMIAFVAKTKTGKTTLGSTISYNLLMDGIPHLVISLEREETDIEMASAARHIGVNALRLQSDFPDHMRSYEAYTALPGHDLRQYHHQPGATLEDVRRAILQAARLGAKAFILDYIQLIEGSVREKRSETLGRAAQTLANLSTRLGMCSIVNAQSDVDGLPRECEALWLAASSTYVMHRNPGSPETWLKCQGSSSTEGHDAGSPGDPAMMLDTDAGPHFRSV